MILSSPHSELNIKIPPSETIVLSDQCTLKKNGPLCVVYIAGLPVYHWTMHDRTAKAFAMVSLMRGGYADQNDIARVFGCAARTLRRYQQRAEVEGMDALGRPAGRPSGTSPAPSSWVNTAAILRKRGITVRDIAQQLGVSRSVVSKWTTREGKAKSKFTFTRPHPASEPADNSVEMQKLEKLQGSVPSLDPDPTNRMLDRLLARLGKLDDAEPIFAQGKRIPHAGILLAVPALVQSGIFSVADEVYGSIGPAFYGLRTTIMALLLMALLRIKRPEALKEHSPIELGRVLGLDRGPEVKTLRRKLKHLALLKKAEVFGRKLAKIRVARRGKVMGFLYIDGHVRVYHGRRRLPKTYSTRMRLALPATTDYWVNDRQGDPLLVVTAELNASLTKILPELLKEIRALVGKRRVTIVFDRGGWSPNLFKKMINDGFDILTYRKGRWSKIPEDRFVHCTKKIEGQKISYELDDRNIRLRLRKKRRLHLRQITRLSRDTRHQTAIVTSRRDLPAVELAYRMFERWQQENFFKYLKEEFALDALIDYEAEAEDTERLIPNPKRRKINKKLATARSELKNLEASYGKSMADLAERQKPTINEIKSAYAKLANRMKQGRKKIASLKRHQKKTPMRVAVKAVEGKPIMKLSGERKHLSNCLKMVAYQAESDLLALLRPHYARADEEGRTLVTTAFQSAADLDLRSGELHITLAPLSSAHRTRAIGAICTALNEMGVCYPGTKLRLRYEVRS